MSHDPRRKAIIHESDNKLHRYIICGDFRMSAPLLTASHHRIRLKIALQNYRRKGGLQMSENQYDAPAMEVVEFGNEDIITESGQLDSGF